MGSNEIIPNRMVESTIQLGCFNRNFESGPEAGKLAFLKSDWRNSHQFVFFPKTQKSNFVPVFNPFILMFQVPPRMSIAWAFKFTAAKRRSLRGCVSFENELYP